MKAIKPTIMVLVLTSWCAAGDVVLTTVGTSSVGALPVAAWHFDELPGTLVARDSIGNVDGQLVGDATFVADSKSGHAIHLTETGGGVVNMGDNFPFTSGDFSIVAWIKTEATEHYFVAGKHLSEVKAGYFLALNGASGFGGAGKAYFYHSLPSVHDDAVSTTIVNDGDWHQVVGVYHAGGKAEIYVDGSGPEDSKTAHTIASVNAPFLIGGISFGDVTSNSPRSMYTGLVDEVQLYGYALTSNQIEFLFHNPGEIIPEPATLGVLALGGLLMLRRR